MTADYTHYISKQIKKLYRKRLIAPFFFLLFAILLLQVFPILSIVSPSKLTGLSDMSQFYGKNDVYLSASLSSLKFTGYTKTRFGRTVGYFYYTSIPEKDECCIVLLSPSTCEQGLSEIPRADIRGKIIRADKSFQTLLDRLFEDLSWTKAGIRSKVTSYYLSEPDFHYQSGMIFVALSAGSAAFAALSILICIVYIARPDLSPPCRKLRHFGKPRELLAMAEEELATLPQLATEDMFITEHFFIETSKYGIALVPIQEILWIYKHSTLHKLFRYHFSITYTLNIIAKQHVAIHCPKNIKSDIDGIIDYLSEANHDILVGFSEENRRKAVAASR